MPHFLVDLSVVETIGVAGFILYILNYSLLTLRCIEGHSLCYFAINLAAASAVLVGLTQSFNLASALIQVFWVAMSMLGIVMHLVHPRRAG